MGETKIQKISSTRSVTEPRSPKAADVAQNDIEWKKTCENSVYKLDARHNTCVFNAVSETAGAENAIA